jgi:hypothetical protein
MTCPLDSQPLEDTMDWPEKDAPGYRPYHHYTPEVQISKPTAGDLHLCFDKSPTHFEEVSNDSVKEIEDWKELSMSKESNQGLDFEEGFEYDVVRSTPPIKRETIRVRVRNVKEAPSLERSHF